MKGSPTSIYAAFFLAAVAFSGCETVLDFHINTPPKLTIISHLTPDNIEGQRIYVFASLNPSDSSQFYTPDNLVVDVSEKESNVTVRLDAVPEGEKVYYLFPEGFIKAGFTYSITAFAPGFDPVQAETIIPRPSAISNLIIKDFMTEQSGQHEFKKIIRYKLEFSIDHFESNQFYHLVFYNEYQNLPGAYLMDPKISDEQPFIQHYDYGILVDRADLTEGEPLTFEFQDWAVENNDLIRVYVELRTITEAYYKYHATLARQLIVRQDPFAEPVTIFNNIEGGYGNFSGFSQTITSSDLPH
jgi:hypothetical protein